MSSLPPVVQVGSLPIDKESSVPVQVAELVSIKQSPSSPIVKWLKSFPPTPIPSQSHTLAVYSYVLLPVWVYVTRKPNVESPELVSTVTSQEFTPDPNVISWHVSCARDTASVKKAKGKTEIFIFEIGSNVQS